MAAVQLAVPHGGTLASLAAARNCNEALMWLLERESAAPQSSRRCGLSGMLRRRVPSVAAADADREEVSEDAALDGAAILEENSRLEVVSTEETTDDDLTHYWTGVAAQDGGDVVGRTFALPESAAMLGRDQRDALLGRFLEQESMLDDIHEATDFIPLVPGCSELVAIYTVADLNCLLHAAVLGITGVGDGLLAAEDPAAHSRTVLRNAVRNSLSRCARLMDVASGASPARLAEMQRDVEQGKASLDGGHIFALSNVLRRPIVVYARLSLEGAFRMDLAVPFRVSGVYLPTLWEPSEVCRDPLVMCYSSGHFSALVGFATAAEPRNVSVPLCDEQLRPLPVHFAACRTPVVAAPIDEAAADGHTAADLALLKAYLPWVRVELVGDSEVDHRVTVAVQRHEAIPTGNAATQTDCFKAAVFSAVDGVIADAGMT
jgi:hypothetical protein